MLTALARDDMLVSCLIGQLITSEAGEKIGNIDDLIMENRATSARC